MLNQFWRYNSQDNNYVVSNSEPMSVFPTIVRPKEKIVYCRNCHRWEYILSFKDNTLKTQCGRIYSGPFALENSIINYGYNILNIKNTYKINIKSQSVEIGNHRRFEDNFTLDLTKKILYKENKPVYESIDVRKNLCPEITNQIIDEMGSQYKQQYGIAPSVASKLKGFSLLIGYMVSPFNINFYKISQHWGLNPYDENFISLSSGNSPSAEREMFECLNIKPSKSIRKLYQEMPQSVITYAALLDLGFSDVNLLMKAAKSLSFYAFFKLAMISFTGGEANYDFRIPLKEYVANLIEITNNQKAVFNSIERTVSFFIENHNNLSVVADGINMYYNARENLSNKEKKDIMHEGFNQYTHDFLVRRFEQITIEGVLSPFSNKKILNKHFELDSNILRLEYKTGDDYINIKNNKGEVESVPVKDEDRYCFYIPKCTNDLKTIGSEMHNCVGWGGYGKSMDKGECIIVYALHKNKFRICIELSPDFYIRQALGPHNQPLEGDDYAAFYEWCKEKGIQRKKAFR